jgi:hypothetical protein
VAITATPTDGRAVVRLHGRALDGGRATEKLPLKEGRNLFPLEVTAADGKTERTYMLKVIRAAALPNWVRVLPNAPFKIRDSEGELVFKGRMWILGGYTPELVTDVWSSPDGADWTQAGSIPDESGVNIPVQFAHAGRMWVSTNNGRFYCSEDGAAWKLVTDRAPWAGRYAAGSAVFNGRMWVAGGLKDGELFNDVWSSADGEEWRLETAEAPWSPRQVFGNLVAHDGKLFLIGGGITAYQPFRAYSDVWSSPDGRSWTRVTERAPWPGRIWSSCAVYRGRLWLLGGYRAQPVAKNFNDVWYSRDGSAWERLETESVWEERHELSPFVLGDALWVVAGNAWPLMNDAWKLELKGLSFLTQPVLEEFSRTRYRYEARADFNRGGGAVRYRLTQGPEWLKVDEQIGVVTGVPGDMGEFPVTLEAFDEAGETARQAYVLSVIRLS